MKSIRIQGLRSLKDSGYVDIKALTLLLGENSSGKSTFLRTFPLLRQSIEAATRGPMLWYGSYVDFGSFEDALSHFSEGNKIDFSFKLNSSLLSKSFFRTRSSVYAGVKKEDDFNCTLSLIGDNKESYTRIRSVSFEYASNKIYVAFSKNNKITEIRSNDIDFTHLFTNAVIEIEDDAYSIFPLISFYSQTNNSFGQRWQRDNKDLDMIMSNIIDIYAHGKSNIPELTDKLKRSGTTDLNDFIKYFKRLSPTQTWKKKTSHLSSSNNEMLELHAALFASRVAYLVHVANWCLVTELSSISYIAPLRATAERYYRNQELSVNEVDFQGKNLAMFIKNLGDKKKDYKSWMFSNFGFFLNVTSDGGHLSLRIHYSENDSGYNVTDMGFGFSQILPILTQLWFTSLGEQKINSFRLPFISPNKYLVIEQPELHLHPRFQAKMVDVFVKMINFIENTGNNLKIVIETHSETIVNQIGHRILLRNKIIEKYEGYVNLPEESPLKNTEEYKVFQEKFNNSISNKDVSIVIFDKVKPDEPTTVSTSEYDKDGNLINWPWGFFEPELDYDN
ncbi:AAA family ATPase [Vibrio fluvialis]|nr:AAA family ATPase [Vibrio fluvialis]